MRSKKRWRHYCDYCKKSGAQGPTMERHEAHCTLNPQRGCRMCEAAGLEQQPMEDLIEALDNGRALGDCDAEGMKELRKLAQGCPACMLAAIRIRHAGGPGAQETWDFDFRQEANRFWARLNEEGE